MSLLTTVQRFCERTNINTPNAVLGSTDPQIKQVKALLEEEGTDLAQRAEWQVLVQEATHTTVATESQGDIDTIFSNGFRYIKNGTGWDRTEQLPLYDVSSTDWQQIKANAVTGSYYEIRMRGNELLAIPTPTAGNTWAFEYISYNWITDSTGATYKEFFTQDTDLMLLPERILLAGLRWRWKKEKGLEYAEDFASYERLVNNAISRQGFSGPLSQANRLATAEPKIVIPDGSWAL